MSIKSVMTWVFTNLIAMINLSTPIVVLFIVYPALLHNPIIKLLCSLGIGLYIWLIYYFQTKNLKKKFIDLPSTDYRVTFDAIIKSCNAKPEDFTIKYAYTAQQLAITFRNTIIIDPINFTLCNSDSNCQLTIANYKQHSLPHLNLFQQKLEEVRQSDFNDQVQKFIVRHEIGHIINHYTNKKLFILFASGFLVTWFSISIAQLLISMVHISIVLIATYLFAIMIDHLLTFASNYIFKAIAEKNADLFAAKHSTVQEITATAHFFSKEHEITEQYKHSQ